MNRKYTAGEYLEGCRLLRKYFDHPALTTDVIVGFGKQRKNLNPLRKWCQKLNSMRLIFLNIQEEKAQEQIKWKIRFRTGKSKQKS